MDSSTRIVRFFLAIVCAILAPCTASAQSAAYVSGGVFADIRKFGAATDSGSFGLTETSIDSTGIGGGLRVGTWLHPRWTVELGVDVGAKTTVDYKDPIAILIFPAPPQLNLKASSSFTTVSTMLGFHTPPVGRVRLGYLAGFSFVRAVYKTDYVDQEPRTNLSFLPGGGIGGASLDFLGLTFPPRRFTRATRTSTHNTGAIALGFEAAIDLTSRIVLVPEVRALAFSKVSYGSGAFLIRPGVGVRWNF